MRGYIGITDTGWYDHLQAKGPALEEVNFWQPNGGERLMKLLPGTPFLFKLKRAQGDAIVGFASYVRSIRLPIREAWQFFGDGNGGAVAGEAVGARGREARERRVDLGFVGDEGGEGLGVGHLAAPVRAGLVRSGDQHIALGEHDCE